MFPNARAFSLCLLLSFLSVKADAALVRGSVTTTAGNTLPGATVAVYASAGALSQSTTTNASGQYELTPPAGSYRLLAYDLTGTYATVFYGNAESFETTVLLPLADASPVTANFALPPGGTVTGSVLGANAPVAGAVVEAYNLSGTRRGFATTDAAGQYSLVLPAGDYKVFAYDTNGFFAGEFAGNIRAFADASPVRVNPPSATPVNFALERAAHVSGTVIDAATRAPLAAKAVYAYTAAGALVTSVSTDGSGAFRFALGPGPYRFVSGDPLRVYGPSFYENSNSFEQSSVITLAAGDERSNVTLAAERGAIITGHAEATVPLNVAAYNLDGTLHATATTNAAGLYALVVAPGDYKLAAYDPAGAYATQFHGGGITFASASTVTVLTGQTLTAIDFHPPRAGRFTGTVRDGITQQPLGSKTVAAYDAAGMLVAETKSAANGTYTLAITPGQYRVVAFDAALDYATAYAGATSYEASLPRSIAADQSAVVDFALTRGVRVTGVVRHPNGSGIEGAEVFALDGAGNRVAGAMTSNGAFTIVVVPGTYAFTAIDPRHRFPASTIASVFVGATSPAPLTFTVTASARRRAARA